MIDYQRPTSNSESISRISVVFVHENFNGEYSGVSRRTAMTSYSKFEMPDEAETIKTFNFYLKRFDKAWTKLSKA